MARPSGGRPFDPERSNSDAEPAPDLISISRALSRINDSKKLPKAPLLAKAPKFWKKWYRRQDRVIERASIRALVEQIERPDYRQLGLTVANCWPNRRCRSPMCAYCRYRRWLYDRRRLEQMLGSSADEDIVFCTVVIGVSVAEIDQLRELINGFKKQFRQTIRNDTGRDKRWLGLEWRGRIELDYFLPETSDLGIYKQRTLSELGYVPNGSAFLLPHLHVVIRLNGLTRKQVRRRLRQQFPGFRRVEVRHFRKNKSRSENIDFLSRYMLKNKPPILALPGRGSKKLKPRQPEHLLFYVRVLHELGGFQGLSMRSRTPPLPDPPPNSDC
jgi:hypothetical protein